MPRWISKLATSGAGIGSLSLATLALAGCGGSSATVTGSVIGITFQDTKHVYFGGPFIVVSNIEVDCKQVAFVRESYEAGSQATTDDMQLLQFSYDSDVVEPGNTAVGVTGPAKALVVKSDETHFEFSRAESGSINVDEYEDGKTATGTFTAVTFEDGGVLDGEFDAEWCRNLRAR